MAISNTARRAAMKATTMTPGWAFIKDDMNKTLQVAVQAALDEKDKELRDYYVIRASAMQQVLTEFFIKWELQEAKEKATAEAFEDFEVDTHEVLQGDE